METAKYLKNNFSYCFKKKYDYEPILKLRKLKSLNHFLVKKCISSKYLKLLDIVGEINLNNLI